MALVAGINLFTMIIPVDAILVAGVWAHARKWWLMGLAMSLGSTLGAAALAHVVGSHGFPPFDHYLESLRQTESWRSTTSFSAQYGHWAVFVATILPMPLMPVVALAAITQMSFAFIVTSFLAGRTLKCFALAWAAGHAPKLVRGFSPLRAEIEKLESKEAKP